MNEGSRGLRSENECLIAQGLAFGFMSYTIVKLLAGRWHENNAVTYTLTALFLLHFFVGS